MAGSVDRRRRTPDPGAMGTAGIRVVHALPRRVRVKVGALKGNPRAARHLEEHLNSIPGVRQAQANPVTGSVLVLYHDSAHWRDSIPSLAEKLAAVAADVDVGAVADRLAASPQAANGAPILEASDVRDFFHGMNETVRSTTAGLDLKLLVPLVLVFLGVRGLFAQGVSAPRWYDLLWFGFGTFMMLNAAGVAPARAVEEAAEVAAAL
jgi:hypothetical protein